MSKAIYVGKTGNLQMGVYEPKHREVLDDPYGELAKRHDFEPMTPIDVVVMESEAADEAPQDTEEEPEAGDEE